MCFGSLPMEAMLMTRMFTKLALAVVLIGVMADVALASVLPGPFEFSFFTSALPELFLLPFALAGCT